MARELSVEVTVRVGRAAEAVPAAEVLTREHPLREEGWRLLALALWAVRPAGRRAGRAAPGPPAPGRRAGARPGAGAGRAGGDDPGPARRGAGADRPTPRPPPPDPRPGGTGDRTVAAGRVRRARAGARTRCRGGRTAARRPRRRRRRWSPARPAPASRACSARFAAELAADGWTVVVGRCPEADGAPAGLGLGRGARPARRARPRRRTPRPLAPLLDGRTRPTGGGDAAAGRFRLHRAVGGWLRAAAADASRSPSSSTTCTAPTTRRWRCWQSVADELDGGAGPAARAPYRPADGGERLDEALAAAGPPRAGPRRARTGWPPTRSSGWCAAVHGRPLDAADRGRAGRAHRRQPVLRPGERPAAGQRGRAGRAGRGAGGRPRRAAPPARPAARSRRSRCCGWPPWSGREADVDVLVARRRRRRGRRCSTRWRPAWSPACSPSRRRAGSGSRTRWCATPSTPTSPSCGAPACTPGSPRSSGELRPGDLTGAGPPLRAAPRRRATAALAVELRRPGGRAGRAAVRARHRGRAPTSRRWTPPVDRVPAAAAPGGPAGRPARPAAAGPAARRGGRRRPGAPGSGRSTLARAAGRDDLVVGRVHRLDRADPVADRGRTGVVDEPRRRRARAACCDRTDLDAGDAVPAARRAGRRADRRGRSAGGRAAGGRGARAGPRARRPATCWRSALATAIKATHVDGTPTDGSAGSPTSWPASARERDLPAFRWSAGARRAPACAAVRGDTGALRAQLDEGRSWPAGTAWSRPRRCIALQRRRCSRTSPAGSTRSERHLHAARTRDAGPAGIAARRRLPRRGALHAAAHPGPAARSCEPMLGELARSLRGRRRRRAARWPWSAQGRDDEARPSASRRRRLRPDYFHDVLRDDPRPWPSWRSATADEAPALIALLLRCATSSRGALERLAGRAAGGAHCSVSCAGCWAGDDGGRRATSPRPSGRRSAGAPRTGPTPPAPRWPLSSGSQAGPKSRPRAPARPCGDNPARPEDTVSTLPAPRRRRHRRPPVAHHRRLAAHRSSPSRRCTPPSAASPTTTTTCPARRRRRAPTSCAERLPELSGADARVVVHDRVRRRRSTRPCCRRCATGSAHCRRRVRTSSAPRMSADGDTALLAVQYDVPVTDFEGTEGVDALRRRRRRRPATPACRSSSAVQVPENISAPSGTAEADRHRRRAGDPGARVRFGGRRRPAARRRAGRPRRRHRRSITLLAAVTDISTTAPTIATMVGIGVGIDYALLLVTRYVEGLRRGLSVRDAAAEANATAGLVGDLRRHDRAGLAVRPRLAGAARRTRRSATPRSPGRRGHADLDHAGARAVRPGRARGCCRAASVRRERPVTAGPTPHRAVGAPGHRRGRCSSALLSLSSRCCALAAPVLGMRTWPQDAGSQPDVEHHPAGLRPGRGRVRAGRQRTVRARRRPATGCRTPAAACRHELRGRPGVAAVGAADRQRRRRRRPDRACEPTTGAAGRGAPPIWSTALRADALPDGVMVTGAARPRSPTSPTGWPTGCGS